MNFFKHFLGDKEFIFDRKSKIVLIGITAPISNNWISSLGTLELKAHEAPPAKTVGGVNIREKGEEKKRPHSGIQGGYPGSVLNEILPKCQG